MEKYIKLYKSVHEHYLDEVPMNTDEPQFVQFLNVHGRYDEVSVYYSGQKKDVNIGEIIDLTTDYLVAKGFESMANIDGEGVVFAFDRKFINKRGFVSMDYLIEFLEKEGFDCHWYKTEREIVLRKEKVY
jgi:hypothetical protein